MDLSQEITTAGQLDAVRRHHVNRCGICVVSVNATVPYAYTTSTMTNLDSTPCELVFVEPGQAYQSRVLNEVYTQWKKGVMVIHPGHSLVINDEGCEIARLTVMEMTEEEVNSYFVRSAIDRARINNHVYRLHVIKDEFFDKGN